jgi:hypothetical protein
VARTKTVDNVVRQFTTYLPCRLTDDELRDKGSELAHARETSEKHEAASAEVRKELKDRESMLEGEVSRLARIVRDRQEQRPVCVEVRLAKKAGMVDEVRIDTGEIIATRKIADREAQADMLDVPPNGPDEIPFGHQA